MLCVLFEHVAFYFQLAYIVQTANTAQSLSFSVLCIVMAYLTLKAVCMQCY